MRPFPPALAVILGILAIIFLREPSSDFPSHELTPKDREVVQEVEKLLLNNLNLQTLRIEFLTETKERYILSLGWEFLGPLEISLRSFSIHPKELKVVAKQIMRILEQIGMKAEAEKVNDLEQRIVSPQCSPELIKRFVENCGKYFYELEVVPDIKKSGTLFYFAN